MLRYIRWTLREWSHKELCRRVIAKGQNLNMTELSQMERRSQAIPVEKAAVIAHVLGVDSDILWESFGDNPNLVRQRERNDELTMRAKGAVAKAMGGDE